MEAQLLNHLYLAFTQCQSITIDTRAISEGTLYFALKGERFDGNSFAREALEKGALYAIIDDKKYAADERTILVPDTLEALQQLALYHRKKLGIPILAITGTNGKTTTKELINNVLATKYNVVATQGNLNNHIGVPLTLLSMTASTQIGVVEMGANHVNEISQLCSIASPDYGLITNIGKAHLEGFGGFEGVVKAKSELYTYLMDHKGTIIYNSDNELLTGLVGQYEPKYSYGLLSGKIFRGKIIPETNFLSLEANRMEKGVCAEKVQIDSQLFGSYNAENLLAACTVGTIFSIPLTEIHNAIGSYIPKNNRSQIQKTAQNTLLLDCYNANPSSTGYAIKSLEHIKDLPKTIILGDMLELGDEAKAEHKQILDLVHSYGNYRVFTVGPIYKSISEAYNITSFSTPEELMKWIEGHPITGNFILIKGSRGIKLEKVIAAL